MNVLSAFMGFLKSGGGNITDIMVVFVMFFVALAIVECMRRVTLGRDVKDSTSKGIISFYLISIIFYTISNYISGNRFYSKFFSNEVCIIVYRFSFALGLTILLYLISISVVLIENYTKGRLNV